MGHGARMAPALGVARRVRISAAARAKKLASAAMAARAVSGARAVRGVTAAPTAVRGDFRVLDRSEASAAVGWGALGSWWAEPCARAVGLTTRSGVWEPEGARDFEAGVAVRLNLVADRGCHTSTRTLSGRSPRLPADPRAHTRCFAQPNRSRPSPCRLRSRRSRRRRRRRSEHAPPRAPSQTPRSPPVAHIRGPQPDLTRSRHALWAGGVSVGPRHGARAGRTRRHR